MEAERDAPGDGDGRHCRSGEVLGVQYHELAAVGALVVALLLLNAVAKLMGQLFDLTMNLLKAIATVGFIPWSGSP